MPTHETKFTRTCWIHCRPCHFIYHNFSQRLQSLASYPSIRL